MGCLDPGRRLRRGAGIYPQFISGRLVEELRGCRSPLPPNLLNSMLPESNANNDR